MKTLLFTTRNIQSKFNKSLIEQMSLLKNDDITFLTPLKTDKGVDYIKEIADLNISNIIRYDEYYHREVFSKKYNNWLEYVEKSEFDLGSGYDRIIVYGSILSDAAALTRKSNGFNKSLKNRNQMNFIQNGIYLCMLLQLIKYSNSNNIPLYEFCYDTAENSLSQLVDYPAYNLKVFHGYDFPEYKMHRLDSLQHYLLNKEKGLINLFTIDKIYDIVFGYTVLTKDRIETGKSIKNSITCLSNYKLFEKNKFEDIDTFVDRDTYLEYIKQSKYTILVKPYDEKQFSIFRFIESIYSDCLPLLETQLRKEEFKNTFNIDQNILEEITVDYDKIGQKIVSISEERREELLEYFKNKILVFEKGFE